MGLRILKSSVLYISILFDSIHQIEQLDMNAMIGVKAPLCAPLLLNRASFVFFFGNGAHIVWEGNSKFQKRDSIGDWPWAAISEKKYFGVRRSHA